MRTPVVRLGVLGCADIAARRVLPEVATTSGLRVVAVASRTGSKAQALAARFGAEAVTGYQALLDRDDVDAVYIPLPTGLHAEWITRALLAGKHVLAEKPLTTSAADTATAVALARRLRLVLRENYMFPHHTQHAAVRGLLEGGAIGELRAFAATFTVPARPHGDIRHRADLGGGALLDVGGYPLRAAQLFLQPELRVLGAATRTSGTSGVETGGTALLVDGAGVTATLTFGLDHTYTSQYAFVGSLGSLALDHVFTTPATHRPVGRLVREGRTEEVLLPAADQYARSTASFADAVRSGVVADPAPVERQAELIEQIRLHAASAHTHDRREAG